MRHTQRTPTRSAEYIGDVHAQGSGKFFYYHEHAGTTHGRSIPTTERRLQASCSHMDRTALQLESTGQGGNTRYSRVTNEDGESSYPIRMQQRIELLCNGNKRPSHSKRATRWQQNAPGHSGRIQRDTWAYGRHGLKTSNGGKNTAQTNRLQTKTCSNLLLRLRHDAERREGTGNLQQLDRGEVRATDEGFQGSNDS